MRSTCGCALFACATMIAALVSTVGSTAGWAADMTPALKNLVPAADKEGEVVIKTSGDFFDGGRGIKLYTDHVRQAYGATISVKWAPGGSYPDVGNEVAVAFRNNLPSPTDIYIGFSRNMAVFGKFNMFEAVPWNSYAPDRLTDDVVEQGIYVKAYSGTLGFSYNTELAPSKPERMADFLAPEWKGKIATTPFASGFEQLASKEAWGPDKMLDYAKKFATQIAGFMLCTEPDRLASGQFVAFVTDCGGGSMLKAAKNGAPIARVITPDYPMVSYFYFAVPKNAPHPNAAKLFITYLLSPEGQADMYDLTFTDLHLFPQSQTRPQIEAVEKKFGIKFQNADIAWQATNEAGNAAQSQVPKIFQQSGGK